MWCLLEFLISVKMKLAFILIFKYWLWLINCYGRSTIWWNTCPVKSVYITPFISLYVSIIVNLLQPLFLLGERQRDAMVIDFLLFMAWYIFHKYVKPFVSWSFSHFHNFTFWSDKSMNWWTTVEMNIIFWCSIHCKVLTQQ